MLNASNHFSDATIYSPFKDVCMLIYSHRTKRPSVVRWWQNQHIRHQFALLPKKVSGWQQNGNKRTILAAKHNILAIKHRFPATKYYWLAIKLQLVATKHESLAIKKISRRYRISKQALKSLNISRIVSVAR